MQRDGDAALGHVHARGDIGDRIGVPIAPDEDFALSCGQGGEEIIERRGELMRVHRLLHLLARGDALGELLVHEVEPRPAALARPAVLHGAKCWGEVVKACAPYAGRIPAFLFHGFSRSEGLLPQIFAMNGFVSIGPALLNDHAVNYRAMAKSIPLERLLIETDMDESAAPQDGAPSRAETLRFIYAKLAEIRGVDAADLERALDANARRFTEALA